MGLALHGKTRGAKTCMKKALWIGVIAALAFSGCGSVPAPTPVAQGTAATSIPTASADPSSPASSPTLNTGNAAPTPSLTLNTGSSHPEQACGPSNVNQAVSQNIAQVPEMYAESGAATGWIVDTTATESYDACLDLSWVVLPLSRGTGSSPYQIMLFHRGEYIGTPSLVSFGFYPRVARVSDDAIEVGYSWPDEGQPNAAARVQTVMTYRYNPDTGGVTATGQWPDYVDRIDPQGNLPINRGLGDAAPAGAGGDIPGLATEAPITAGEQAIITSPTGNIVCSLDQAILDAEVTCGVLSLKEEGRTWAATADTDGSSTGSSSALMSALSHANKATEVAYGTSVYRGFNTCMSTEAGMVCWNISSGKGFMVNRDGVITF